MRKKYLLIMLIALFALSNCKRDNGAAPQVFTAASYPLAVGNWWQYQLTDIASAPDTFMLSVISETGLGVYTRFDCNYIGAGTSSPAGYFLQSDTSLSFTHTVPDKYFVSFPDFHLSLPAAAGQKFPGAFPGDTVFLTGVVASYTAYGHTYEPCYYLGEGYDLPHNSKTEEIILTPKVGLIYQSINFISDTADKTQSYPGGIQTQQSINLINYHVQ